MSVSLCSIRFISVAIAITTPVGNTSADSTHTPVYSEPLLAFTTESKQEEKLPEIVIRESVLNGEAVLSAGSWRTNLDNTRLSCFEGGCIEILTLKPEEQIAISEKSPNKRDAKCRTQYLTPSYDCCRIDIASTIG